VTDVVKVTELDPSAHLDSEETIAESLSAALEEDDPGVFLAAIGQVAKVRDMSAIAQESGLAQESLHKAFRPGAKPRYATVQKALRSLGVKINVSTAWLSKATRDRLRRYTPGKI
jgi:probable addiction module antidote protein